MRATAEQLDLNQNYEQFDRRERVFNDTTTWLAEALNGSMRTNFEYHFDGQELYGEDGGRLGEIFDDAIEAAQVIAEQNPNLLFELRRRLIERDEYEDMLAIASGELPNTMVVVSDFPPELMPAQTDIGGYNAERKQTMLRVITRQTDGSLRMTTQSLDGSNRQALEAIYGRLGFGVKPGELLEQRMHLDLPEQWQAELINNLTDCYDHSMEEQFGGNWHAGRPQASRSKTPDTYEFARAQKDLVEWFVEAKLSDSLRAEQLRFKLAATAHQRYENYVAGKAPQPTQPMNGGYLESRRQSFYQEIEQATRQATHAGRTFSGCGASVSALYSTETQMNEAGYGNKTGEKTSYKFDKEMFCVVCQAPPKKNEGKKKCGPCGICKSCDKDLSSKG